MPPSLNVMKPSAGRGAASGSGSRNWSTKKSTSTGNLPTRSAAARFKPLKVSTRYRSSCRRAGSSAPEKCVPFLLISLQAGRPSIECAEYCFVSEFHFCTAFLLQEVQSSVLGSIRILKVGTCRTLFTTINQELHHKQPDQLDCQELWQWLRCVE